MAGLVTSRVLSEHFARVTVLERDAAPEGTAPRPGVPQGWHFHTLLSGGLRVLRALFPGIEDQLVRAGSLRPAPDQFYFFRPEGKSYLLAAYMPEPRADDGQRPYVVQTRGLLEATVRLRVQELGNVTFRYGTRVEDVSSEAGRVTGVKLHGGEQIEADMVFDALGRGGRTLQWLDQLGFARPVENVIQCDFAYTSVFMRPRDPDAFKDAGFFVISSTTLRCGGLVRMEHGMWLATAVGNHGDYPPRDLRGFKQFCESLGNPFFSDLLAQADPISEPAAYRFGQSARRRFELLERFPEGLMPIGDAVCHTTPVYGQGMSAACRQAMALQQVLAQRAATGAGLDGLWRDLLPALYRETRAAWLFAARMDFFDPRCRGDFPTEEAEVLELLGCVLKHAGKGDAAALELLLAVQGLELPLEALRAAPWPERAAAARAAKLARKQQQSR
jgi:2-polyprenyl-6-methoxyphenol hydroxylase-like FAD-dependent oxidoreductase